MAQCPSFWFSTTINWKGVLRKTWCHSCRMVWHIPQQQQQQLQTLGKVCHRVCNNCWAIITFLSQAILNYDMRRLFVHFREFLLFFQKKCSHWQLLINKQISTWRDWNIRCFRFIGKRPFHPTPLRPFAVTEPSSETPGQSVNKERRCHGPKSEPTNSISSPIPRAVPKVSEDDFLTVKLPANVLMMW